MTIQMRVHRTHPDAILPTRSKPGDSGLDLYALLPDGPIVLRAGARQRIRTGIAVELPDDLDVTPRGAASQFVRMVFEAQVRPRSGLAAEKGVMTAFGTIDNGYRGDIGVTLFNHSFHDYTVRPGDRIAQLVVVPVVLPEVVEAEDLSATERGESGFGSTGK
jgi:dUTP pyrophosphatase